MHWHITRALQCKQGVFGLLLAVTVGIVTVGLGGRCEYDRHLFARSEMNRGYRLAQRMRQIYIALQKFGRMFRAVYTRQVKDKVHPMQHGGQLGD